MLNNLIQLKISDFRLWLHLGCSDEEKHHVQCISFDISINFTRNPNAMLSDKLEDAICYSDATKLIKDNISSKRYNLIESLAFDVHRILADNFNKDEFKDISISVTVNKLSPPVPDIHGSVSFTYSR